MHLQLKFLLRNYTIDFEAETEAGPLDSCGEKAGQMYGAVKVSVADPAGIVMQPVNNYNKLGALRDGIFEEVADHDEPDANEAFDYISTLYWNHLLVGKDGKFPHRMWLWGSKKGEIAEKGAAK